MLGPTSSERDRQKICMYVQYFIQYELCYAVLYGGWPFVPEVSIVLGYDLSHLEKNTLISSFIQKSLYTCLSSPFYFHFDSNF